MIVTSTSTFFWSEPRDRLVAAVSASHKLWFHNIRTYARTLRQAASIL
ncbi:hypothetical protein [Nostoc sp.]